MKQYHVKVSIDAQNDLCRLLSHLLYEINSSQAFDNVLDDFEETLVVLKTAAGIHAASENAELVKRGLRRIKLTETQLFHALLCGW